MDLKKKSKLLFILIIPLFLLGVSEVKAYELPDYYYYAVINDSKLGQIELLFPKDKVENLSIQEETQIINVGSTNITAYSNDSDYSFTFQPFQYGRYNSNYQNYVYLDITEIVDTNIDFIDQQNFVIDNSLFVPSMFLFIGGLLCLIWLKR